MSTSGLSRRGLLRSGFSRVARELDDLAATQPATDVPSGEARSGDSRAARLRQAAGACGDDPVWEPARRQLRETAGRLVAGTVLDVTGEPDPVALAMADQSADAVVSAFAPACVGDLPEALDEMARVCRSGGVVALGAWSPIGVVGALLRLADEHDPPPAGVPRCLNWGRDERLRVQLERHGATVEIERHALTLRFADPRDAAERLRSALGPLRAARSEALDAAVDDAIAGLTDGAGEAVVLRSDYLVAAVVVDSRP